MCGLYITEFIIVFFFFIATWLYLWVFQEEYGLE